MKNSKADQKSSIKIDPNNNQAHSTEKLCSCSKSQIEENTNARSLTVELEWLNTDQAADYLCLSSGALRNLTSEGKVPYYKLGQRNRYLLDDLRNLLMSQRRGGSHGNQI